MDGPTNIFPNASCALVGVVEGRVHKTHIYKHMVKYRCRLISTSALMHRGEVLHGHWPRATITHVMMYTRACICPLSAIMLNCWYNERFQSLKPLLIHLAAM